MKLFFIILILAFYFGSCRENTKKPIVVRELPLGFVREIPSWFAHNPQLQANFFEIRDKLNLVALENGFDSIYIRIWFDCLGGQGNKIVTFQYSNSKWKINLYSYNIVSKQGIILDVVHLRKERLSPVSEWSSLVKNMFENQVPDLPDYSTYGSDYTIPTDATGVTVEVATFTQYRVYSYPALSLNDTISSGPAKLERFIKELEKGFDFHSPCQR